MKNKKIAVGERIFFFSGTNVPLYNGIFFSGGAGWNFLNLKGVFVYVPHVSGHKISVKGALGVGGGGEELLLCDLFPFKIFMVQATRLTKVAL